MAGITVAELCQAVGPTLDLNILAGWSGRDNTINTGEINRPGLALTGFTEYFSFDRVQILGKSEAAYLASLGPDQRERVLETLLAYAIPCLIQTAGQDTVPELLAAAEARSIPVLGTSTSTARTIGAVEEALAERFAPEIAMHGGLVEIFGLGVLLMGASGVGKSECALALIERGHRLVADDVVRIRKVNNSILLGMSSEILQHHMEIRGLGIINIQQLFGARAVRSRKRVELVVQIEEWEQGREYDRTGLDEATYNLLGVQVPLVTIPVKAGRNTAVIVEVAAMNQRLKMTGVHPAREFDRSLSQWIASQKPAG